jgi:hypothetical protein
LLDSVSCGSSPCREKEAIKRGYDKLSIGSYQMPSQIEQEIRGQSNNWSMSIVIVTLTLNSKPLNFQPGSSYSIVIDLVKVITSMLRPLSCSGLILKAPLTH